MVDIKYNRSKKTIIIFDRWAYKLKKKGVHIETILNLCTYSASTDRPKYITGWCSYFKDEYTYFRFIDHNENYWEPSPEELNNYILETMNRYNIDYEMIVTDWQRKTYKLDSEKYQKAEKIINDSN